MITTHSSSLQLEHEALIDRHLLVIFLALKLECVQALLESADLGLVERVRLGVPGIHIRAIRDDRQVRTGRRDRDQVLCCCLVYILLAARVWLRVLDIIDNPARISFRAFMEKGRERGATDGFLSCQTFLITH